MREPSLLFWGLLFVGLTWSGCGEPTPDITERLRTIPGLSFAEQPTSREGYRFFHLTFEQPADHGQPQGQRFQQRLTLLHRDEAAPTVITTSGYFVSLRDRTTEVTRRLSGNQIAVEHRFFGPSRPEPANWSHLSIPQAAADHHRIIEAFRSIYSTGRWISTGASKGGMASVFHRRFYPNDVHGTVAYVAPLLPVELDDRYGPFIERVGKASSDPSCGEKLQNFQREVLSLARRPTLEQEVRKLPMLSFSFLGASKALEHATLEMPFYFWQYGNESLCPKIPDSQATHGQIFAFLDQVHPLSEFSDGDIEAFRPYYYQSGTEEGYPLIPETGLMDLVQHPGTYVPRTYLPKEFATIRFDPKVMEDVGRWVRTEAREILFVYGENDPWSAAPFEMGTEPEKRGLHTLWVKQGNHGAQIAQLSMTDLALAEDLLRRYSGVDRLTSPLSVVPSSVTQGLVPGPTPPESDPAPRRVRPTR